MDALRGEFDATAHCGTGSPKAKSPPKADFSPITRNRYFLFCRSCF